MRPLLLTVVLLAAAACSAETPRAVNDFESCVAAGNAVSKSLPAQCKAFDGTVYDSKDKFRAAPGKLCVDRCGDGVCQEIVCMGEGCPCPESKESCPADCK